MDMTAEQHKAEAHRLLAQVAEEVGRNPTHVTVHARLQTVLALAQVHATLATIPEPLVYRAGPWAPVEVQP